MQLEWRNSLKKHIEEQYIQDPDEWYETIISPSGRLSLTIISKRFRERSLQQRQEEIEQVLQSLAVPIRTGYLSLYTPEQAKMLEMKPPQATVAHQLYNWFDLASYVANAPEGSRPARREPRIPSVITFYSFKGGVGHTTALTHVAAILARRGRKVIAVDLDIEAPGLGAIFKTNLPPYGIVDYFYEHSYLPEGEEPTIPITEIFGEIPIANASGRLFVVPAGELNLDYLAKIDDLRANVSNERGDDLWSTFYREITTQLEPDIILVDARTGLNEWGAFSLLRAADKAIVFQYPNEQNSRGIRLLTQVLSGVLPTYFVFSPVPAVGNIGMEMVKKQWIALQSIEDEFIEVNHSSSEDAQIEGETDTLQNEELDMLENNPIVIPYHTAIALSDAYPVEEILALYSRIANIIEEDANEIRLEAILTDAHRRWELIRSLHFPEVDAMRNTNLENTFQRTSDFDRFLDSTTCLICGKKGTGKTELYTLLLKHGEKAKQLSHKRLDNVYCVSGHGSFRKRPARNEFQLIGNSIEQRGGSWEAFWRAYLFLRLQQEDRLFSFIRTSKFQNVRNLLTRVAKGLDEWKKEYTDILIQMTTNAEIDLLLQDILSDINNQLQQKQECFWFLYDDLDVDFREEGPLRNRALTSLFQFMQSCDARKLKSIGFKIFLREDIWCRLNFDNKSHLNGRDITLKWTRRDFLKLALRQANQSSEFYRLVDRFAPIDIDQATEEDLDSALQLLWGNRREQNLKSKPVSSWVYERLTDSDNTTFPRILTILLRTARDYELEMDQEQPYPADRLLRMNSLVEGLKEASRHRCDELRNEYQELSPFFDSLANFGIVTTRDQLQKAWQDTIQNKLPEFSDFNEFISFLRNIGLIRLAERSKERGYRFAEIYTHGFGIYRGTRKY